MQGDDGIFSPPPSFFAHFPFSRGDTAYLYDNYLLINQNNLFFNSNYNYFSSLTDGISDLRLHNYEDIADITIYALVIKDLRYSDEPITHLAKKYSVNKSIIYGINYGWHYKYYSYAI